MGRGQDVAAANIICDVLDKLHSYTGPIPHQTFDLSRQFESLLNRAKQEQKNSIYYKTARVAEALLSSEINKRLLHGDIHHTNILNSATRGWLAIDPQGLFGELTYDTANCFYNPDNRPSIVEQEERIAELATVFSERLEVEYSRVLMFTYAHGGLSCSWQLDDNQDPKRRIRIVGLIKSML